jgi:hypothetical protein
LAAVFGGSGRTYESGIGPTTIGSGFESAALLVAEEADVEGEGAEAAEGGFDLLDFVDFDGTVFDEVEVEAEGVVVVTGVEAFSFDGEADLPAVDVEVEVPEAAGFELEAGGLLKCKPSKLTV